MYLSILFDEDDQLVAAAPACDQQLLGNVYWREYYPQLLGGQLGETAVLDVKSPELVELLLGLANDPDLLPVCRTRLAAYERQQTNRPVSKRAA